ncbi:MAG TPA: alpha/beta hydrolase [Planctomycetaceae bacterium]|nr:alpha/beta hydrolase [Planctomycetaceae bacterium]
MSTVKPLLWRGRMVHFAKRVLLIYLVVMAVVAWLQRSLMFPAAKTELLLVAEYPAATGIFAAASDVAIVAGDHQTIRGWMLQSDKKRSDRLVILFHGNGGDRSRRWGWYELLRSINVDVLAMDYRGYADSDGSPSEKTLTQDATATWKYATQTLGYQPGQIILLGESLGGGVGVKLASTICQQGEEPAGLVLVSTFSSMLDTASNRFWWLPVRFLLLDRFRSDLEIGHVTCPVLQFHGTVDSIIPLRLGQRLHELTPSQASNGIEKKLIIFNGTNHNDVLDRHGVELRDAIRKFIEQTRNDLAKK